MTPTAEAAIVHARTLPPEALVTVAAGTLVELATAAHTPAAVAPLLTVHDLASHFRVADSTARGWLAAGRCPGGRRLGRLGWRLPPEDLATLDLELQATGAGDARLDVWRSAKAA